MCGDIFTAFLKPGIEQDAVNRCRHGAHAVRCRQAVRVQNMMKKMVGDDGLEPPTSSV
jgi:hypothetical protein